MKSVNFLDSAAAIQEERGQNYDQPSGERSAGRIAAAFNAITGKDLTPAEVYLLLQVTKDVRQWSSPGYHHDSALDCVSYAALKAEALFGEVPRPAAGGDFNAQALAAGGGGLGGGPANPAGSPGYQCPRLGGCKCPPDAVYCSAVPCHG